MTAVASEPAAGAIPAQAWRALAIVSSAMFMSILDLTVLNVSFPYIERTFHDTPRTTLAWLSSGYAIALASLLLVSGRLADKIGIAGCSSSA